MKCLRPVRATCLRDPSTNMVLDVSFKDDYKEEIYFGCGTCIYCQCRLRSQRTALMLMELQTKQNGCFLTLTYNDENLPKKYGLNYNDLSLFIHSYQRFLLRQGIKNITYVKAGEYGGKTNRQHYHINFFGLDMNTLKDTYIEHGKYYSSERIANIWKKGFNVVVPANELTCKYTAGYTVKKLILENAARLMISQRQSYGRNHHAEENGFTPYLPRGSCKNMSEIELQEYRNKLKKQREVIIDGRKYDNPLAPSRTRIFYDKERKEYIHEPRIRFSDGFGDYYYKKWREDFYKGFIELEPGKNYRIPLKFMNILKKENYEKWLTIKKQSLEHIKNEHITYESDKSFQAYMFYTHSQAPRGCLNFDVMNEQEENELERCCEGC